MPNKATILAAAALVVISTIAAAAHPNDPRHWRRRAHAPPLPYPQALNPQTGNLLPRLHLHRQHGAPVTPYPGALYPSPPIMLPEGFTMTVEHDVSDAAAGAPQQPGAATAPGASKPESGEASDAPIGFPRDVSQRIAKCWKPKAPPPGQTYEITLRMSFTASGAVIGGPRITYVKAGPRKEDEDDLRASILDAVQACTPLRFTPALGSAIAGHMFAIRFVAGYRVPPNSPSL